MPKPINANENENLINEKPKKDSWLSCIIGGIGFVICIVLLTYNVPNSIKVFEKEARMLPYATLVINNFSKAQGWVLFLFMIVISIIWELKKTGTLIKFIFNLFCIVISIFMICIILLALLAITP